MQEMHHQIEQKAQELQREEEEHESMKATEEEIRVIISKLKRRKATGHDLTSTEAAKYLPAEGVHAIPQIIKAILEKKHK